MNKVLLIEDRVVRQSNALGEKIKELENFNNLMNIAGGVKFEEIKNEFLKGNFSPLDEYSVIMIHRLAFDNKVLEGIKEYLKKKEGKRKLVLFSGGISTTNISIIENLDLLTINVNDFYSDNLFYFLKNGSFNLMELAFGENWKFSLSINLLEKIELYIKTYKPKKFYSFKNELSIDDWVKQEYFSNYKDNDVLTKVQLETVIKELREEINKLYELLVF